MAWCSWRCSWQSRRSCSQSTLFFVLKDMFLSRLVLLHVSKEADNYLVSCPAKAFNRDIFEMMRPRSSVISSGSHVSLFHALRNLRLKPLGSEPSSWYVSNVWYSVLRTLWHPSEMLCNSFCCFLARSWCSKMILTSSRIIERLLTLENQKVSIGIIS